jgi:mono/diheme cytochrome c family protein
MRTLHFLAPVALLAACNPDGSFGQGGDIAASAGDGSSGQALFASYCSSCHGSDASGGAGPDIRGVSDSNGVIDTILYGEDSMPGFSGTLSDAEISDILAWLGSLAGGGGGGGGEGGEGGEGEDD